MSLVRSWPLFRKGQSQPRKHEELSSNNDVSNAAGIGGRPRETSMSFKICCSSLASGNSSEEDGLHDLQCAVTCSPWPATHMIDKNILVPGLKGTRLGGGRKEYQIRASHLDTMSAQFVVFQWGYGATSRLKVADGGTNMSTGVSLVLRADLYPTSCICRRFDPPS